MTDIVKKITAVFSLALIIISILQGVLPTHVLCIKSDGQAEVEATCSCHHDQQPDHFAAQTESHESSSLDYGFLDDHCGPCIDIPITIGTSNGYILPADNGKSQNIVLLKIVCPFSQSTIIAFVFRLNSPIILQDFKPSLKSVRTDILLI